MVDVDTLLIDGAELPHVTLEWPYEWPYQGNPESGDVVVYPGIDGGVSSSDRAYPPKILSVPVSIDDETDCGPYPMASANLRWQDVVSACKPARNVTLTRRMTLPGATVTDPPVNQDVTSVARYSGMVVARPVVEASQAVIEFMLLEGVWYGDPITIGTGAVTVEGTTRTHRMTITLAGGTNQVLTNTTNGWSLSYSGASGAGVVIDVKEMTVTGDSAENLQWTRRLPFRLDPGANTLSLTGGGTASITYHPAYL